MEKNQEFISVINSLLLIVDYKPNLLTNVMSGQHSELSKAMVSAAKAATILNVPVVMSSSDDRPGIGFIRELSGILPRREIIRRNPFNINALADPAVRAHVKEFNREKLIVAALWTSECLTETALGALDLGYDVYCLMDAAGDTSKERHAYGVHRMLKAGITPVTWMSLASEWMNGWAVPAESRADETPGKNTAMLEYLARG